MFVLTDGGSCAQASSAAFTYICLPEGQAEWQEHWHDEPHGIIGDIQPREAEMIALTKALEGAYYTIICLYQKGLDLHRDDGDKNDSLPPQGKGSSYGDREISPISDDRLAGIGGTEATANQCHENGNNHDNSIKLETLSDHRAGAKFGFYEYEKLTGVHMGNKGTLATVEVHWRPSSVSLQDLPRTALPEVREIFLKMYTEREWDEQMELLQNRGRPSKRRRFGVS
ncbi:hypothetical protein PG985_005494 [Apiospora marii]|uniref:uncharacterized protein n=1 Tax=Apiospora marii TaxID=335849 RepID=UPI0031319874